MRSVGTYRQNEEHNLEVRRDRSIPVPVRTVERLAMGPSEFCVSVPYRALATFRKMTESGFSRQSRISEIVSKVRLRAERKAESVLSPGFFSRSP